MSAFDRLHPALQHHVASSLGWRRLRPLQEAAIAPVLAGEHVLLLAPTAGGKTEAALLPLLSRMLAEDWRGLSLLWVCPIKALLNDLEPRLAHLAGLLGRRVARWHGDVGPSARRAILREPPDLLLTTPESIEVLLTSVRSDHRALFAMLRGVVVDEVHAFAGDDRGWHLLALLERLVRLRSGELQRLGLSATVGNPAALLDWLAGSSRGPRRVVAPPAGAPKVDDADVQLDAVGTLENAATVVARLYQGEKRLVFCDSRARVERLAAALRQAGVSTFVSHSSLALDERRRAEEAFAVGRDAVIVATSTLELGLDVGDLDRVIQIDAPATVASFLQRLGRTGRRPGTRRHTLFLATSDDAFLRAAGLLELWSAGYVEPVVPPPLPLHVLAQQLLALILQEGAVGRRTWRSWIGELPVFAAMGEEVAERLVETMLARGIVCEDSGLLGFGPEGERSYGYRNFRELMSVFASDPLVAVRHGHEELGQVHPLSLVGRGEERPVILLGGRSWAVKRTDWKERVAWVEPASEPGWSQWLGGAPPLRFELCRAVRRVLARGELGARLSRRGRELLARLRADFAWVDEAGTTVVRGAAGELRWWTFAGLAANAALGAALGSMRREGGRDQNLFVPLAAGTTPRQIEEALGRSSVAAVPAAPAEEALEGLKLRACLPADLARQVVESRLADPTAVEACRSEPVRFAAALA